MVRAVLAVAAWQVQWKRIAFWLFLFYCLYTSWPVKGQVSEEVAPQRGKEITLIIYPRAVIASAFQRTTIRVEWHIARHPDNRQWAFAYEGTNGDLGSSQGQMFGEKSPYVFPICTRENERPCFREVAPGEYWFSACVFRVTNGKVVKFCDRQILEVGGVG